MSNQRMKKFYRIHIINHQVINQLFYSLLCLLTLAKRRLARKFVLCDVCWLFHGGESRQILYVFQFRLNFKRYYEMASKRQR